MADFGFEDINKCARYLEIDKYIGGLPDFAFKNKLTDENVKLIGDVFSYISHIKRDSVIDTLLRLSRLPQKVPKTFENFCFDRIYGPDKEKLESLSSLSAVYSGKNLAFIGPPGVGKTHLAMAFGTACCKKEMKTYFLKASELNQRFTEARKYGREGSVVNGLVKPTCLIIDEVGHCNFDTGNTRLFFDMVDRRYSKDTPNCMIFTSNIVPGEWSRFFSSDQDLLCSLDRIFDDACVYSFRGTSYRGRKCETFNIEAGVRPPASDSTGIS